MARLQLVMLHNAGSRRARKGAVRRGEQLVSQQAERGRDFLNEIFGTLMHCRLLDLYRLLDVSVLEA